ncbi:MAG: YbaB/EbfC family nucleoid-associated protein [Planctomycetota bacterium]
MFEQMKAMREVMSLLGNPAALQEKMQAVQEELKATVVEGSAGAGAVTVKVTGAMEVVSIELDRAMVATIAGAGGEADAGMVSELIVAATNAAMRQAREVAQAKLGEAAGGLDLGSLGGMLPGGGGA